MFKYLEVLFRHWIRFVVLILVIPAIAGAAGLYLFQGKTGSAQIWVDNPGYIGNVSTATGWNQYLTPAQNTVDSLGQLVATQSYYDKLGATLIADGTVGSTAERDQVIGEARTTLRIYAVGSHLITLGVECTRASICVDVLSTTITVHRDWLIQTEKDQAAVAIQFYTGQLQLATESRQSAIDALNSYEAAHPMPQTSGQPVDPQLSLLESNVNSAQTRVSDINDKLLNIQFSQDAASQIDQTALRVIDQPTVSGGRFTSTTKKMAMIIGAAAVIPGLLYLGFLGWIDRTARNPKSIEKLIGVRVVSTIGSLNAARHS
jgi:hypothetical protein